MNKATSFLDPKKVKAYKKEMMKALDDIGGWRSIFNEFDRQSMVLLKHSPIHEKIPLCIRYIDNVNALLGNRYISFKKLIEKE